MTEEQVKELIELRDQLGKIINLAINVSVSMIKIESPELKEFTYCKGKMFLENDEGEYFFSIIHSVGAKLKIPSEDV